MEWLIIGAGGLLILVGLLDVFFTALHYDGFGFLSSSLYRRVFDAVIFSWAPVIPQAPSVLHQGLAAIVVAGSVLIIVLVLLPTSRRAYT